MDKSLNILIAEDECLVLFGLKEILTNLGHCVIGTAENGRELVELAFKRRPDLLIVDINLPIMDGIEAIEFINSEKVIPSIIITGYDKEEFVKRANKAGVFYYLVKPIDEKELKPAIQITMGRFEEFLLMKEEITKKEEALEGRKYIEKAKGIVMDRGNLKEFEAMKILQKKSRDSNRKLVDIAKDIVKAAEILELDKD